MIPIEIERITIAVQIRQLSLKIGMFGLVLAYSTDATTGHARDGSAAQNGNAGGRATNCAAKSCRTDYMQGSTCATCGVLGVLFRVPRDGCALQGCKPRTLTTRASSQRAQALVHGKQCIAKFVGSSGTIGAGEPGGIADRFLAATPYWACIEVRILPKMKPVPPCTERASGREAERQRGREAERESGRRRRRRREQDRKHRAWKTV
eukprot:SAG22_NODE_2320_length_2722_cov_2.494472_4_plen_207_part_00